MEQYLRQGLKPDSKVLDIRQVDVSTGRFLEDNTPVFVITFTTQEVLLFRDRKTREVLVGAENRVEQCNYAAVVTRVEEELENELTGGWKVIEASIFFDSSCEMGLMMVSESRWRVDRVAHIYNLA
jgi:mitochondrial import inner membrane translocase subunit TIM44